MAFYDHILAGAAVNKIIEVQLFDPTTGQGFGAIPHGDITATYVREGGTVQPITLAAGSPGDAYSSGKWAHLTRGVHQFHVPNPACEPGAAVVTLDFAHATAITSAKRLALVGQDARLPVHDAASFDFFFDLAATMDGTTLRKLLRYVAAAVAGNNTGTGASPETYLGLDGATKRMEVAYDGSNNRTVTYDPP